MSSHAAPPPPASGDTTAASSPGDTTYTPGRPLLDLSLIHIYEPTRH